MAIDIDIPTASTPALFARLEPTCDPILKRYALNRDQWCDLVFYRDAQASQFYARRCGCLRWRHHSQPSRVTLNCFGWRVTWLPEVGDDDE